MDADATPPVVLEYPFRGRWLARNSPARRVPSHGTHQFGVGYAIDFIGIDERGRPAPRTWRTALATEDPERFSGFGRPVLAPVEGDVVATHGEEPDHAARRSPLTLLPYLVTQGERARRGVVGLAGNHVVIALSPQGPFVLLAHLRQGSVCVQPGDRVEPGQTIGSCGNSGNSTQPHVHVQVMQSLRFDEATRGVPLAFRRPDSPDARVPAESEIVDV